MSQRPSDPAEHKPYVPASTILPEITLKAVLLGMALSAILGAANAYLGLFAGMTVSASIPAAVISMAVLKLFKSSNILENNIVQTAASAGESLAAGVIFTIPALILLGVWTEFDYLETTLIAGFGGLLGVLFTIPLRRALIVEQALKFPEGVATAEVLKAGGFTLLMAINLMLFSLVHNPCSTTIYTIWKETRSVKWTTISALLPLGMGFVLCFVVTQAWRLVFGG